MLSAFLGRTLPVLLLAVVSLIATGAVQAQEPSASEPDARLRSLSNALIEGLRDGDAQRLLDASADRVEISLFGARTFYSQAQAFYVVRDFFRDHPPQRFALRDTMQADASYFLTGRYWHTRTDQPLTVLIRMRRAEGSRAEGTWNVHEIRIEAERR